MRDWLLLLGGVILWAIHFFVLYGIGEFAGHWPGARIAIAMISVALLLGMGALILVLRHQPENDAYERWRRRSGLTIALLGGVGILWQSLPALLLR